MNKPAILNIYENILPHSLTIGRWLLKIFQINKFQYYEKSDIVQNCLHNDLCIPQVPLLAEDVKAFSPVVQDLGQSGAIRAALYEQARGRLPFVSSSPACA